MRRLSLIVAIGLATGSALATPTRTAVEPIEIEPEPIFRCVVDYLRVDGLPLVQHSWCTRRYPGGPIIPLLSLEGQGLVFGVRPYQRPADPPIPKHQRRLE